jgi:hypothetical protein
LNAAAYTAVEAAESEESLAHAINAESPMVMAEKTKKLGAARGISGPFNRTDRGDIRRHIARLAHPTQGGARAWKIE